MATKFTPEQRKAIELRDKNILVCAAAGSGKTAVLVQRIIEIITSDIDPVDIDRLLVVTFTNAAAAEMRERIGLALGAALEKNPECVHLQKQLSLLHNAQITTIDSFCLFLIRNNFNDIGLDPGFRIADEGELTLLKQDVLSELLEDQYQERDPRFLHCVEYFTGGSNDKMLEEYLEGLYEFSMSYPWPEDWISQCKNDYKITDIIEMQKTPWCEFLVSYIRRMVRECKRDMEFAITLSLRPDGPYMYSAVLEQEDEMIGKLCTADSFSDFYRMFQTISFGRLPAKKDDTVDLTLREKVQQIRKEIKKRLEMLEGAYFALSPEQALARMEQAGPAVEELLSLVLLYKERLDAKKRRDNIIDFHDMEHFALQILLNRQEDGSYCTSAAAKEYRQYFKEILTDEYQDSNLVQELILKSISGEEEGNYNRFMVGDVKQSIYRFRLARPELFMEKYNCYSKGEGDCQRIDLHKNFRSRCQVLDSVNEVFAGIMGAELGGVEYDEEAALYPGAEFAEGKEKGSDDPYRTEYLIIGKNDSSTMSVKEQEAEAIARKIRQIYSHLKVTDRESGKLRPVRYRDIAVLLRTTAGWAEEFRNILEREGIPAYVVSRTGYFQAAEIKEILQLLHVIDNPCQDIPLFGAMKSYFGGFTEEEIARIRAGGRDKLLYDLLCGYEGEMEEKVHGFVRWLLAYRQKTAYTPIHRLIQEILTDTGYLDHVAARQGGEQRRANVEMLLTRAASFEQTSFYGLFHFLRYIEQLEKYEVDYGEADVLDENADVVRIMSIHKSKGLEFPVCFVAGLSKRFNMQDASSRLIADVDMGVGADYVDSDLRVQSRTLKKSAVSLKMRLDALGEEMRVLYVAMTRAREKLILTGMTGDIHKFREALENQEKFYAQDGGEGARGNRQNKRVNFSTLAGASCYMDFLMPFLGQAELISQETLYIREIHEISEEMVRKRQLSVVQASQEIMTKMSEKFERTYPYQYLSGLFVKTTVSELKKKAIHGSKNNIENELNESIEGVASLSPGQAFTRELFEEPEVVPYIPSFISSKEGISGTDRGSAYHKVMELLDLKAVERNLAEAEIKRQIDLFVQEERMTSQWRDGVDISKIMTFLESSLARRMMDANAHGKLWREQPFVIGLTADRVSDECPSTEQVLIQGIIDVFFEEEGKIIVADYKTDMVNAPEELIKRYQVQLDYYGEALERITGKEVVEKVIYSFSLGREIKLSSR